MKMYEYVVNIEGEAGPRLDVYLTKVCEVYTRKQISDMVGSGEITVNGAKSRASYHVKSADILCIKPLATKKLQTKSTIDIPIIYEDSNVVVINKPAGIITHNLAGKNQISVEQLLSSKIKYKQDRAGIVHRLDKDTSGVMIIAKTQEAAEYLQAQFQNRTVEKNYTVLVHGHLENARARVELPIAHSAKNYQTMEIATGGKMGVMEYEVEKHFSNYDLANVTLKTGRTHQIRVQLNYLGHPVVGDKVYGKRAAQIRQFVHASTLSLKLPSGTKQTFRAPLADDLQNFLNCLN